MSNTDTGKQISGEVNAALAALASVGPLVAQLTDPPSSSPIPGAVDIAGVLSKVTQEPAFAGGFIDILVGSTAIRSKPEPWFQALVGWVGYTVTLTYVPRAKGFTYEQVVGFRVSFA